MSKFKGQPGTQINRATAPRIVQKGPTGKFYSTGGAAPGMGNNDSAIAPAAQGMSHPTESGQAQVPRGQPLCKCPSGPTDAVKQSGY